MGLKAYQTKTGVELRVIQGGGQGDGIARAQLQVVSPDFVPADPMAAHFEASTLVYIQRASYLGGGPIELVARLSVDAEQLRKHGPEGLVVDLSNWIYRRFNVGVHNPSIAGLKDRSRKGFKTLTFHYEIHETVARAHGFRDSYGESLILNQPNKVA